MKWWWRRAGRRLWPSGPATRGIGAVHPGIVGGLQGVGDHLNADARLGQPRQQGRALLGGHEVGRDDHQPRLQLGQLIEQDPEEGILQRRSLPAGGLPGWVPEGLPGGPVQLAEQRVRGRRPVACAQGHEVGGVAVTLLGQMA